MSDTIFTAIVTAAWTQVSSGFTGMFTNAGSDNILYLEAASLPAASVTTGHTLYPRNERPYNLAAGQEVYARAISSDSVVTVTPGVNFRDIAGNIEKTIFASAERTADENSADFTNDNAKGIKVVIDVTIDPALASVVFTIEGKDPVSGKYYPLLVSAAINAVGTTVLTVYPGVPVVANVTASDIVPTIFRVSADHTDADSITYSVSGALIK